MDLGSLKPAEGAIQKKKRVGRGNGSGYGSKCGRGTKGYNSRSGYQKRIWFEGGQTPLYIRLPKIGFNNKFSKVYQPINVGDLNKLPEKEITPELLSEYGMIRNEEALYKILGDGDIEDIDKVVAPAFSESAKDKIEEAGGEIEEL